MFFEYGAAETVLLSGLHRPDVFSFGDLAILRGLRMVYRHREISRERFEVYRRRYSPCGSVASIYLWAVACGALPELTEKRSGKENEMIYTAHYDSPLGEILLAADEEGLTGLWFVGQKYFAYRLGTEASEGETPAIAAARRWLDTYFSGSAPDFTPPLRPVGSAFQRAVWDALLHIPYGKTTTYGALAHSVAARLGRASMSAQAVGGAVGHNPVSLIIPCHRVVGADGSLTGYAGGIDKKVRLLKLEGADLAGLFVPKRGTAL